MNIGHGLGLDSLGRIYHQKRPLTCGEGARNFIGEIHVPRSINQIETIGFSIFGRVAQGHGVSFDGDPALTLQIHGIKKLGLHIPLRDQPSDLQKPIGQRGFSMVHVRNNTKVSDQVRFHRREKVR